MDKIRILIFQNIFISKIILKFENRICSILHCPTRFEMSQLARTSQLSKREIHVRNRETGIETRETRNETRETKVGTSLLRGVIGYESGGSNFRHVETDLSKNRLFLPFRPPNHGDRKNNSELPWQNRSRSMGQDSFPVPIVVTDPPGVPAVWSWVPTR